MLDVHYTPGDGMGWALDEDLRLIRSALGGLVRETSAAAAEVIHAPFWQNLPMVAPQLLDQAFVIAHADNPPFFYLKQPEFLAGQQSVDLWVARSREAFEQFKSLRLPVEHIPYAIDPELFHPLSDKASLRREFGIPEDAYVIANFHRDSEGANLNTPKTQKAPEFLLAVLKRLRDAGAAFHVLLAGPRRHWLRDQLRQENISFTFVGRQNVETDDFGINILDRTQLNKLYNASDVYLIPSRWEGGPQSAMEAAACRIKILSTPLGVARDILEPDSLVRTPAEAAARLRDDIEFGGLAPTVPPQFDRWKASHTTATMSALLRDLYSSLPGRADFKAKLTRRRVSFWRGSGVQFRHFLRRRLVKPQRPLEVAWDHREGELPDLDEILRVVRRALDELGIGVVDGGPADTLLTGLPQNPGRSARRIFQWIVPGFPGEQIGRSAVIIAPAVQDVLNLRRAGFLQPMLVSAVPMTGSDDCGPAFHVPRGDSGASIRIWRAMVAGKPVFYPEGTAYSEQVFHAGSTYPETAVGPVGIDPAELEELRSLAKLPMFSEAVRFIDLLLRN